MVLDGFEHVSSDWIWLQPFWKYGSWSGTLWKRSQHSVCPGSLGPYYIVSYYICWVKSSRTYSSLGIQHPQQQLMNNINKDFFSYFESISVPNSRSTNHNPSFCNWPANQFTERILLPLFLYSIFLKIKYIDYRRKLCFLLFVFSLCSKMTNSFFIYLLNLAQECMNDWTGAHITWWTVQVRYLADLP